MKSVILIKRINLKLYIMYYPHDSQQAGDFAKPNTQYQPHNNFQDTQNLNVFNAFEDKNLRLGFVRKVYSLLTIQLLFTFGCSLAVNLTTNSKDFMISESGQALYWISLVGLIMIMCIMMCNYELMKKYPSNYILFGLFTLCMTYQITMITAFYSTKVVLLALASTGTITTGLTIYACQTKYDFTDMGGYLLSLLLGCMLIGIINLFIHNSVLQSIYAGIGAIIFSCYIVYDTQLIIGGSHRKYKFDIDDYILATISLYLDIINLFIFILELLNGNNR